MSPGFQKVSNTCSTNWVKIMQIQSSLVCDLSCDFHRMLPCDCQSKTWKIYSAVHSVSVWTILMHWITCLCSTCVIVGRHIVLGTAQEVAMGPFEYLNKKFRNGNKVLLVVVVVVAIQGNHIHVLSHNGIYHFTALKVSLCDHIYHVL